MKMAELLRQLADRLDSIDQGNTDFMSSNSTMNRITPVSVEKPEDDEVDVMVPPLQSKLELLKKSVGVENVYDEDDTDELSVIKKNAGLNAAQHEASEDNDITG
jgi:hypothetical protein